VYDANYTVLNPDPVVIPSRRCRFGLLFPSRHCRSGLLCKTTLPFWDIAAISALPRRGFFVIASGGSLL